MEVDSNLDVKPDVASLILTEKLDFNRLEREEGSSSSTLQNDQHEKNFSSDHARGILPFFPIVDKGIALSAREGNLELEDSRCDVKSELPDHVHHKSNEDNFSCTVEEEKPCIATLRASVAAYSAGKEMDKRNTEFEATVATGMSAQESITLLLLKMFNYRFTIQNGYI